MTEEEQGSPHTFKRLKNGTNLCANYGCEGGGH